MEKRFECPVSSWKVLDLQDGKAWRAPQQPQHSGQNVSERFLTTTTIIQPIPIVLTGHWIDQPTQQLQHGRYSVCSERQGLPEFGRQRWK